MSTGTRSEQSSKPRTPLPSSFSVQILHRRVGVPTDGFSQRNIRIPLFFSISRMRSRREFDHCCRGWVMNPIPFSFSIGLIGWIMGEIRSSHGWSRVIVTGGRRKFGRCLERSSRMSRLTRDCSTEIGDRRVGSDRRSVVERGSVTRYGIS